MLAVILLILMFATPCSEQAIEEVKLASLFDLLDLLLEVTFCLPHAPCLVGDVLLFSSCGRCRSCLVHDIMQLLCDVLRLLFNVHMPW